MDFTEKMVSGMVMEIHGSYKVQYHPNGPEEKDNIIELDFSPPWRRVPLMKGLADALKMELPSNKDLHTEEAR